MASLRSVSQSTRSLFRASLLRTSPSLLRVRQFQTGTSTRQEDKGETPTEQDDRNSLKPWSSEYTMSGYDGDVADKWDTSFNPKNTAPEEEFAKAGNGNNVLEASGANRDISKFTDERCDEKADRKERSLESKPSRKHGKYLPSGGTKPTGH
ncbi:hypothetical protein QBC44DRAFT_366192 [Cladorrhinum sp. PSN332]|nr:hypothetical protein QBC44DRAFT_366192 [Cladorrhinum sp. PSN332]